MSPYIAGLLASFSLSTPFALRSLKSSTWTLPKTHAEHVTTFRKVIDEAGTSPEQIFHGPESPCASLASEKDLWELPNKIPIIADELGNGASGSWIAFTQNQFVVKLLLEQEGEVMLDVLRRVFLRSFDKQLLLIPICWYIPALFDDGQKRYYVVMPALRPAMPHESIVDVYDIKDPTMIGSLHQPDLVKFHKAYPRGLRYIQEPTSEQRRWASEQLDFLRKARIVDYSVLVMEYTVPPGVSDTDRRLAWPGWDFAVKKCCGPGASHSRVAVGIIDYSMNIDDPVGEGKERLKRWLGRNAGLHQFSPSKCADKAAWALGISGHGVGFSPKPILVRIEERAPWQKIDEKSKETYLFPTFVAAHPLDIDVVNGLVVG